MELLILSILVYDTFRGLILKAAWKHGADFCTSFIVIFKWNMPHGRLRTVVHNERI